MEEQNNETKKVVYYKNINTDAELNCEKEEKNNTETQRTPYYKNLEANHSPEMVTQQEEDGEQQAQHVPQAPQKKQKKKLTDEENHIADILSIVSLVLMFGVPLSMGVAMENEIVEGIDIIGANVIAISILAAWIVMIVVRVKYTENTFGKVIMWIYLSILILAIVLIVTIVVTCISACGEILSIFPIY